ENVTAAVTGGTGTATVATQHHGGGAALELGVNLGNNAAENYTPTNQFTDGNAIGAQSGNGLSIWGEKLILNGIGNTTFNDQGALVVLSNSATTVAPYFDSYAFTD